MSEIKQILEELLEGEVPRLESRIEEWEKDYDAMRQSYEGQVRNTLAFKAENEKLRAEVKKADDARLALIKKVNHLRDWQRRARLWMVRLGPGIKPATFANMADYNHQCVLFENERKELISEAKEKP